MGLPKNPENWRKPPFNFQDPDTGDDVQISNVLDQHRMFNGWKDNHFEFSLMLAHPATFMDRGITAVLQRLRYCERFHVPPFPNDFTQHPEWWIKAVVLMDRALKQANEYKAEKQG